MAAEIDLKHYTETPHFVLVNQIDPIILNILRVIFLIMTAVFICLAAFGAEMGLEDQFTQIIFGVCACVEFILALFLPRILRSKIANLEYVFYDKGFGMRMHKNPNRLYLFIPYDCVNHVEQSQTARQKQLQTEKITLKIDREKHKAYPSGYWRNARESVITIQNQATHMHAKTRIKDVMKRL